jgi:hypothetical protein
MSSALRPPSSSTSPETFGDFDLIKRVKLDYSEITVSSWRSRVTGLNVVHLDHEGERIAAPVPVSLPLMCIRVSSATAPIVNGYFVVATESTRILSSP